MIGIDGFHHHGGTCREPTNNKHQTFSKYANKINKKTTNSPFPAPSTRNKQHQLKKTQEGITPSVITRINIFDIKVNDQRKACT